jgi:hypothetical protein
MSDWSKVKEERDAVGNLTDLALAIQALEDIGCDCGEDKNGSCLACTCERALRAQYEHIEKLRQEIKVLIPYVRATPELVLSPRWIEVMEHAQALLSNGIERKEELLSTLRDCLEEHAEEEENS